jgi:hypothetical protein
VRQNFPNPFNNQTTILYELPWLTNVTISLFDLNGRKVVEHNLGQQAKGIYSYYIDSRYLATGTYYYRVKTDSRIKSGKMVLIK